MQTNTQQHATPPRAPARYLSTTGAVEHLGGHVGRRMLELMRLSGTGPKFAKIGRKVVYRPADLDAWVDGRVFSSTSEAKAAGVR